MRVILFKHHSTNANWPVTADSSAVALLTAPSSSTLPQTDTQRSRVARRFFAAVQVIVIAASGFGVRAFFAPLAYALESTVRGRVFLDFNANGVLNSTGSAASPAIDTGIASVRVDAFDADGILRGSAQTDATGNYTLTVANPGLYRVEFGQLPGGHMPSRIGSGNGGSLRFVTTPATGIDLAVTRPADFCQPDPAVLVTQFALGGATDAPALRYFPYGYAVERDGNIFGSGPTPYSPMRPGPITLATAGQLGAIYGLAHDREHGALFASAYVKRRAQLASLGGESTGAIFRVPTSGSTGPTLHTDLNALFGANTAGANPHPGASTQWQSDLATRDLIGKTGLGDLDISVDNSTLFVVNQADRAVYAVPTTGTPAAATVRRFAVPTSGLATTLGACPPTDVRPFGIGVESGGTVFVGAVCSAESSQQAGDLTAYVWQLDTVSGAYALVLNQPLAYNRGAVTWKPWAGAATFDSVLANYEQPMLTDIAFDGADMLLGIRDRYADQTPAANKAPISAPAPRGHGDVLRACLTGATWTLERDGVCGGLTSLGASNPPDSGAAREFYFQDTAGDADDTEATAGALAQVPGFPDFLTTAFSPVHFNATGDEIDTNLHSAGVMKFATRTGANSGAYDLYQASEANTFASAGGVGDIVAQCELPPQEIGNRVWDDSNGNGIQDPGEPGIAGITLTLRSATGVFVTRSATDGAYTFAVAPNTAYTLSAELPPGYQPTQPDAADRFGFAATDNDPIRDVRDSDARAIVGGGATVVFTSGVAGTSNHGIDIGLRTGVSSLRVEKRVVTSDGSTVPDALGQFKIDIVCGARAQTGRIVRDDALSMLNLAAGSNCLVSEDASALPAPPGGYVWQLPAPAQVAIGSNEARTIALTNTLASEISAPRLPVEAINGTVWLDRNDDSLRDAAEPGQNDLRVFLLNNAGAVISQTSTTFDYFGQPGHYGFGALPAGVYSVRFDVAAMPAGTVVTQNQGADDARDSDVDGAGNGPQMQVNTGAPALAVDLGLRPVAQLAGRVWIDLNLDGVYQEGEPVLSNAEINLFRSGESVAVTQTNTSGVYTFTGLAPTLPYSVSVSMPEDPIWEQPGPMVGATPVSDPPPMVLPPAAPSDRVDAGLSPSVVLDKSVVGAGQRGTLDNGGLVTYTLRIRNTSNAVASQIVVSDPLTSDIVYVPGSASPAPFGENPLVWRIGQIAAQGEVEIRFNARVTPGLATSPRNVAWLSQWTALVGQDRADVNAKPTSIALNRFSATAYPTGTIVSWQTALEMSTNGFVVYRSPTERRIEAEVISHAFIAGKNAQGATYDFLDASAQSGVAYRYWLQELGLDGSVVEYGPVLLNAPENAAIAALLRVTVEPASTATVQAEPQPPAQSVAPSMAVPVTAMLGAEKTVSVKPPVATADVSQAAVRPAPAVTIVAPVQSTQVPQVVADAPVAAGQRAQPSAMAAEGTTTQTVARVLVLPAPKSVARLQKQLPLGYRWMAILLSILITGVLTLATLMCAAIWRHRLR